MNETYKNRLGELIPQVKAACGFSISQDKKFLEFERDAWCRLLYGEVPLNVLEKTAFDAIKSKTKRFSEQGRSVTKFGAEDVLNYWYEQKSDEKLQREREQARRQRCRWCKDTKQITVYDHAKEMNVTMPCQYCTG